MQPRYSDGMKVRVRARDAGGRLVYRELESYEDMSGVVLSSKAVVGYILRPITITERPQADLPTTLYMYTVKLEEGITLSNLTEYCLEEISES